MSSSGISGSDFVAVNALLRVSAPSGISVPGVNSWCARSERLTFVVVVEVVVFSEGPC